MTSEETPVEPEPEDTAEPAGVERKTKSKASPLKLNIVSGDVENIPAFGPETGPLPEEEENLEPVSDFTVEDAILLSQSIWNIPGAIFGDHLTPDEQLVKRFGEQLYGYCKRKEINLWDYAFDELPLVISGGMIAGAMIKAQLVHRAEEKRKKEEEEEHVE